MYIPHVLKEVRAFGTPGTPDYKAAVTFQPLDPSRPNPKIIPIPEAIDKTVVQGMWQVVNAGGTGARIKMDGFDIAGKTGTAQVVGLGKDTGKNKDHAWFVSLRAGFQTGDRDGGADREFRIWRNNTRAGSSWRLRRLLSQDSSRRTAGSSETNRERKKRLSN